MDIDTIPPGMDFEEYIRNWIENSDIVLVLIGDNWLDKDADGQTRLDNPEDFVRLEVASALDQGTRLVPVLVEGAVMPRSSQLPADVKRLARLQSIELSDRRWRPDLDRLAQVVRTTPQPLRRPQLKSPSAESGNSSTEEPRVDFPSRFSDAWFERNVPGMSRDQLVALSEELASRGWWPGEMIDRVYCYADDGAAPTVTRAGDASRAAPFEIPSRVHPAWLEDAVPAMDDDQVAALIEVLRGRGWTEGEIEDHVYGSQSSD